MKLTVRANFTIVFLKVTRVPSKSCNAIFLRWSSGSTKKSILDSSSTATLKEETSVEASLSYNSTAKKFAEKSWKIKLKAGKSSLLGHKKLGRLSLSLNDYMKEEGSREIVLPFNMTPEKLASACLHFTVRTRIIRIEKCVIPRDMNNDIDVLIEYYTSHKLDAYAVEDDVNTTSDSNSDKDDFSDDEDSSNLNLNSLLSSPSPFHLSLSPSPSPTSSPVQVGRSSSSAPRLSNGTINRSDLSKESGSNVGVDGHLSSTSKEESTPSDQEVEVETEILFTNVVLKVIAIILVLILAREILYLHF